MELRASGLPRGVTASFAVGLDPSEVHLVIEADDRATPTRLPFTVEAHADGLRRTRRLLLDILPEAVPTE